MARYIVKRFLLMIPTMIGVAALIPRTTAPLEVSTVVGNGSPENSLTVKLSVR